MPIRFSLVVPVFNVAAYLGTFLDSLQAQTLPASDFEIIAVNDGSTDACRQLLEQYAARMPNLRVLSQENRGLSEARNTGLREARGEWLAFADSDDFVAPGTYARWLAQADAGRLDMLLGNGWYHPEGREPDRPIFAGIAATPVIRGVDWLRARLAARFIPHMVWLHLYRRDFIEGHRFRFVPRLLHEDVLWTTRALLRAQRVQYDPEPGYYYRLPARRLAADERAWRLDAVIASTLYNARQLPAIIAEANVDGALARGIGWQLVDGAMTVLHKIEQHPDPAARRAHYRRLHAEGFFGLLWRHAFDARQKRRIASGWWRAARRSLTA